jgi:hypothetical protein
MNFFIGDLAFLAMLIGMNHSAGDHCLMCKLKGSKFNCTHSNVNLLELRTNESVVECLEEKKVAGITSNQETPSELLWSQLCGSLSHRSPADHHSHFTLPNGIGQQDP